jgi:hypothetical protein
LAATQALLPSQIEHRPPERYLETVPLAITAALAVLAILIHGYHPYAEDGGIYLPGILKVLHPQLYPTWAGFVTAQTRLSLFAPLIAGLVRLTGLDVATCMFCMYALSIWATLYAAWQIVSRCTESREARYGSVLILALCITAPAAGTSLLLLDPYVTARSVSTPCGLFALVGALDVLCAFKRVNRVRIAAITLCAASMLVAVVMHPLMGTYAAECVLLLVCASISNPKLRLAAMGSVALFAICAAMILHFLAPHQPAAYAVAALSRDYWFLSAWHWYETAGLAAPLLVLLGVTRSTRILNERGRWLAEMAASAGTIAVIISLLFVHQTAHSYLVAMLQPLRVFQTIYIVLLLVIGALLGAVFLERDPVRWVATATVLGALMLCVQLETFPHSAHIELPWRTPANDWERGFLWIRKNTLPDATCALDAQYIDSPGEDAQSFRAIAERSSVPDYIKDGGITAIAPGLTSEWAAAQRIGEGLATIGDDERRARLVPAHVLWIVLPSSSRTSFDCPYQNRSMKVCRVPQL